MGGSQRRRAAIQYIQPCFMLCMFVYYSAACLYHIQNPEIQLDSSQTLFEYLLSCRGATGPGSRYLGLSSRLIRKRGWSCCKHKLVAGLQPTVADLLDEDICQVPVSTQQIPFQIVSVEFQIKIRTNNARKSQQHLNLMLQLQWARDRICLCT